MEQTSTLDLEVVDQWSIPEDLWQAIQVILPEH